MATELSRVLKKVQDEKQITPQEKTKLKRKLKRVVKKNKAIRTKITKSKNRGFVVDELIPLYNKVDKKESEIRAILDDRVKFNMGNKTLRVKRSYLARLKNPEQYLNKLYIRESSKQVEDLVNHDKLREAEGLAYKMGNLEVSKDLEKYKDKYFKGTRENILEMLREDFDTKALLKMGNRKGDSGGGKPIITSSGLSVRIDFV